MIPTDDFHCKREYHSKRRRSSQPQHSSSNFSPAYHCKSDTKRLSLTASLTWKPELQSHAAVLHYKTTLRVLDTTRGFENECEPRSKRQEKKWDSTSKILKLMPCAYEHVSLSRRLLTEQFECSPVIYWAVTMRELDVDLSTRGGGLFAWVVVCCVWYCCRLASRPW